MSVQVSCPHCRAEVTLERSLGVRQAQCPACREAVFLPASEVGWYYAQNRQKVGPVAWTQLQQLSDAGTLQPTDMLFPEGATQWVPASSVAGLFDPLAGAERSPVSAEPHAEVAAPTSVVSAPDDAYRALVPPELRKKDTPLPTVPGYEILGVLGRGGMGVVYKARQTQLKRLVALKMILTGAHASEVELARFRIEGEAVARLQHPNIVQIYEVGTHDNLPFFSLEFVDGGSLLQRTRGAPQPPRGSAEIVQQLAQAMHFAHQHGIIHRDLKPANVLLECRLPIADCRLEDKQATPSFGIRHSEIGNPKITDFGLAKRIDQGVGQTQTGDVLGTPDYMAPEQATGRIKQVGPCTDIYALGVILYELITGRTPFCGETAMDTLFQVVVDEPVPPSRLIPKVPVDLETICLKCLEKEPRKRYSSSQALADDLGRFLADEPIEARPVGNLEKIRKWAKRRPAIAALSALSILFALSGLGGITWKWREAVRERADKEEARRDAVVRADEALAARADEEKQKRRAEKALADVERNLYFNRIALGSHEWWSNNVGRTRQLLRECAPEHRQWEWHYLDRLCHADRTTFDKHTNWVHGIAFAPDGKRVASASLDKTAQVWEPATGQVQLVLRGHTEALSCVAFSPDGLRLATGAHDHTVRIWDAYSGKELHALRHKNMVNDVAFSPDGRHLASASHDHTVKIWDTSSGGPVATFHDHTSPVTGVAYSPDGKRLAAAAEKSPLCIWELPSGKRLQQLPGFQQVAFSPDGTLVAALNRWVVKVWSTDSGKELLSAAHSLALWTVAFTPDNRWLAISGQDSTIRLIHPTTGRLHRLLRGHTGVVQRLAFSEDNLASASHDRTAKIWNTQQTQEALTIPTAGARVTQLAGSADGRLVAGVQPDGSIRVWDARAGNVVQHLAAHPEAATCVAFSGDGSQLASGSKDGSVKIWNATSGKCLRTLDERRQEVRALAYPRDGKLLAIAAGHEIAIHSPASGKLLHKLTGHTHFVLGLAFSPDGSSLASSSADLNVKLWDPTTGKAARTLQGHTAAVYSVTYSSDGKSLVSADGDGVVLVWDPRNGKCLQTLRGTTGVIRSIALSPDGKRFASVSSENVKLWELGSGREIMSLRGHTGMVMGVIYLDRHRLASCSLDDTIKIWDGTPRR